MGVTTGEPALNFNQLMMWYVAVEFAHARTLEADWYYRQIEARFLVVATRNVLRGAHLCRRHAPASIDRAIDEFDRAAPQAKRARDVLEHFDEYQAGTGRLQQQGELGPIVEFATATEDDVILHLTADLEVSANELLAAAGALTGAIGETIHPSDASRPAAEPRDRRVLDTGETGEAPAPTRRSTGSG